MVYLCLNYFVLRSVPSHASDVHDWDITWCHGISDHRRLNCLFNSLFRLTPRKTQTTKLLSLCEENPLVSNGAVMQQSAPFHNIFMMFLNSCIKSIHQNWNKMTTILQITLSNSFSCIEAPNANIFFQENASVNTMCQKAAIFVWTWPHTYVWDPNLVSNGPANALAPNSSRSSAGSVDWKFRPIFFKVSVAFSEPVCLTFVD